MESPNRRYISQIDEMRAYASLQVVIFHCLIFGYIDSGHTDSMIARNPITALLIEGHTGVSLFLVMSGYILALGAWNRDVDYWKFIKNRIIRIAPLMTFIVIASAYMIGTIRVSTILVPFILLQNIPSLAINDDLGLAGNVWTISVEFQLYLIAPFLFLFVRRYGFWSFVLPLIALVMLLRFAVSLKMYANPTLLWQFPYFSVFGRISQFLAGVCLAEKWSDLSAGIDKYRAVVGLICCIVGLGGIGIYSYYLNCSGGLGVWHMWRIFEPEIEAVLWATFIAGYINLNPLRIVPWVQRAVAAVGVISYSIYLLHWSIFQGIYALMVAYRVPIPGTFVTITALSALVMIPAILAISSLSYLCVERPFLQLRSRYVAISATADS